MRFNRSQKNVEHAERPTAQGRMQAAGLAQISLGRWLMKAQPTILGIPLDHLIKLYWAQNPYGQGLFQKRQLSP